MPLTRLIDGLLELRTDARQLAAARILLAVDAAMAAFEAWRMLPRMLGPTIVRIPFFAWLPVLPASALPGFLMLWLVAAAAFAFGWKTRVAGAVLVLVTAYTLLMDQQGYSNHLYLLVLFLLLLTLSDSGEAWSVDALRRAARRDVAGWPVLLLKIQVSIVYFFSALAKITPRYLSGEMLTSSLRSEGWPPVPLTWRTPGAMTVLAVASIAVELFIAFGLWSSRLRLLAVIAGIGFHLLILTIVDSSRLSLAIFALDMFAGYLLFLDAGLFARRKSGAS